MTFQNNSTGHTCADCKRWFRNFGDALTHECPPADQRRAAARAETRARVRSFLLWMLGALIGFGLAMLIRWLERQ